MPTEDPFYNRKPVPDEFLEHVGDTGLTREQEFDNRERKFSIPGGGDLRKFSNPKVKSRSGSKQLDPHYARKPVPDALIKGVGETGLSNEEEFLNRERKYSTPDGGDLRKFSDAKGGFHPSNDPFYARKMVPKAQIEGVGETGYSKAEEYEVREEKQALFDLSSDPFQQITGSGHRASVSGVASAGAADARRRSSAVAPDHMRAAEQAHAHSGYGGQNLAPIESRVDDGDEIRSSTEGHHPTATHNGTTTSTTTTTTTSTSVNPASNVAVRDETGHAVGETGHTNFYDQATRDIDNIGPHDRA